MNTQKYFFRFFLATVFVFGTMLVAPHAVRAQSSLWTPNPLNSWMANRYHRRANRTNRVRRTRASRNRVVRRRRRY